MKYKLVIFDFDGTLADSFDWFLGVVDELAAKHKFQTFNRAELDELRGSSATKVLSKLGVSRWRLPAIGRHLQTLASRDADKISLFNGVDRMLADLVASGVTVAIVSSSVESNIRRILGSKNVARVAHFECGASLFGKRTKLRKVLRKCGVSAGDALCVGDEVRDIEAAKAEGIPFGAVGWGFTHLRALRECEPEEVFATVGEISAAVSGKRVK
ncbi:MAG: HAD hydrolase-like protein [Nibricoccus sp.]